MAATEIEAWTAMTVLCSGMVPKKTKGKKGVSSDHQAELENRGIA